MLKISLDVSAKMNLLNAISNLDSYEAMTPGVENGPKSVKIPYKLGAARKSLVKNINVLKASLAEFEETRISIFKEIFPEVAENQTVSKDDKPEQFNSYITELNKVSAIKEELELLTFPEAAMFNDTNDFPAASIALLDELGLITYEWQGQTTPMPVPAISFGVVFNRSSGKIVRIMNPDFEQQLDGHHVGLDEFMLRFNKAEYGIANTTNAMTPEIAHDIITRLGQRG